MAFETSAALNPAVGAVPHWRARVFVIFFVLVALAACFQHRAYAPLLLIPLAALKWRGLAAAPRAALKGLGPAWRLYGASALIFCLWTVLSGLWSPLPGKIHWGFGYLACFAVAGLSVSSVGVLDPTARALAAKAVAWSAFGMAVLLSFEALSGAMFRQLTPPAGTVVRDFISMGRGTLMLCLIAWPARVIFAEQLNRPLLGWLVIALAFVPAVRFTIDTNAVILAAGLCVAAASSVIGRRMNTALFAALIGAVWITPIAAAVLPLESAGAAFDWMPDSWRQRLHIYARAGAEIAAHPFGGGVEYARFLSRPMVTVDINGVALNTMPLHPHNLFLHVWMELGAVGALALSGLIVAGWRTVRDLETRPPETAMIAGVLAGVLVSASTEWNMWQVWRLAAVFIAIIAVRLALARR